MKFKLKITLCMLGLLSVLFGVGGSLLISTSFQTTLEREQQAAYNAYQMVLGTLQIINRVNRQSGYEDISQTLAQLSEQNAGSWMVLRLSTSAERIYSYGSALLDLPSVRPEPGICTMQYVSQGQGSHALALAGALEAGGEILYLDMACDISPLFETRSIQQIIYQRVFFIMAVLCAVLSYSISHLLTKPLVALSKASKEIATGQLSSRVQISTRDEVSLVAQDFNAMAASLEEKIRQLNEAVDRQERFMGSFAHELKTPMTSIIGYADLIRGQTLAPGEQYEAANYIVSEGKRLENLSQKLLEILVLKSRPMTRSLISPGRLIEGLVDHLELVYGRQGITLTCEYEDGACYLEPDLVKSLLINLLDNARKAMATDINIKSKMLSDGCQICVIDNGQGIPSAAIAHLTEAFYRADRSRSREQGGVGLGLSLCQEIVTVHHGSMRFVSLENQGTTVIVELRGNAE